MKRYRLDANFKLMGGFWLYGQENEVFTGILSSRKGQTSILSSPQYEIVHEPKSLRVFRDAVNGDAPKQITTLCGFTSECQCTVLYVVKGDGGGLFDTSSGQRVFASEYKAGGTLLGLHIESPSSDCLYEASFYYNKIHHLLPGAWSISLDKDHRAYKSSWNAVEMFRFSSLALSAEITCEVLPMSGGKRKSSVIRSVPRVRISSQMPHSLEWFRFLAVRIENFFTLFLGTSVELTHVAVHQAEEIGWLVQKTRRKREKANVQCWVHCSGHAMANALAIWLAVPENKRPVEKTVLGLMRKSSTSYETEFLSLAQALEAYGRIRFPECLISKKEFKKGLASIKNSILTNWDISEVGIRCLELLSHANEASFANKLGKIYELLSAHLSHEMLGNKAEFVKMVKQTRNYYTHLGISKQNGVIDGGKELFLLNHRLHALLRCVMLLDIGVSEAQLREQVLYQATRWS